MRDGIVELFDHGLYGHKAPQVLHKRGGRRDMKQPKGSHNPSQCETQKVQLLHKEVLSVAPLLRWAGSKRSHVQRIEAAFCSPCRGRYIEPFLGSGASFLGRRQGGPAILSDGTRA